MPLSHRVHHRGSPPQHLPDLGSDLSRLSRSEIEETLRVLQTETRRQVERCDSFTRIESRLLQEIPTARDYDALKRVHDELNALEMERFVVYRSVPALHQKCTAYRDALARRALQLLGEELGEAPPLPYALISMGSDGREEQTLITDQDYLLVYADTTDLAVERYFRLFGTLLVETLERIGFKKCTGDIMPSNKRWRGSITQWQRRLLSMARYESEDYSKNVMDLIILSDARFVAGDNQLAHSLIKTIRTLERDYFQALWGMAKAATQMKVALTLFKRIWTESSGEHQGEFNLKLLGWAPLVMNVRILAINQGIPATSTVRRIELLEAEGSLSSQMARGLRDAYRVLAGHRIKQQMELIRGNREEAYHLAPFALPREEREKLRHALILVEELQRIVQTNFLIM